MTTRRPPPGGGPAPPKTGYLSRLAEGPGSSNHYEESGLPFGRSTSRRTKPTIRSVAHPGRKFVAPGLVTSVTAARQETR